MLRLLPVLLLIAAPAAAADRTVALGNFDRVRVDGPYEVRVSVAGEPGGRVIGEPAMLGAVVVKVEGNTLIVRAGPRYGDERAFAGARGPLPTVEIAAPGLRAASVSGGGRLNIAGPVAGERVDLTVTGTGAIAAPGVAADLLIVQLIGDGTVTLGGTARTARLVANGGGAIAAGELVANDALIRTEGPVAVTLTGRYTVSASSTGSGPITILGNPECKVRMSSGGTITCRNQTKF